MDMNLIPAKVAQFEKVSFEQFKKDWIKLFKLEDTLIDDSGIRYVYDNIKIPERKTKGSAGHDISIPYGIAINIGTQHIIPTGLRCKMCEGWVMLVFPRSSKGIKVGLFISNTIPLIDGDYYDADNEGHIMLAIESDKQILSFKENESISQAVFLPFGTADDKEITAERKGGIGSTGR